jgi:hypothetical protein
VKIVIYFENEVMLKCYSIVTSYTAAFSINGSSRVVEVLEVDMQVLRFNDQGLDWPKFLPPLDGAMLW